MKKTLSFSVTIKCPRRTVWDRMLSPDGYRTWTAAFTEGSYFAGSWEEGQKIRFMAPNGEGMVSVIAENRPYEHVSIRHIGQIAAGVEDTTSPEVLAWAPAYEKFSLADTAEGCVVSVSLDTLADYENYMQETYPKALQLLKASCEQHDA